MKAAPILLFCSTVLLGVSWSGLSPAAAAEPEKVNAFNFPRAETDMYFSNLIKEAGGLGKFQFVRVPAQIENQTIIRMNRDTLYGSAVFDLDAGPVTITLPDAGKRFCSVLMVNQDHYAMETLYAPAKMTFTRESMGTRYCAALVRVFINPADPADLAAAHALQDSIKVEQAQPGSFEVPMWDKESQDQTRNALLVLSGLGGTKANRFGKPADVDPLSWLLSTAAGWGGNPPKDAIYIPGTPANADGKTAYTLTLKDVPVDAFWSVTVYDAKGFMFENPQKAYSMNDVTAKKEADGSVKIQFGGSPDKASNFLAITPGWNYLIRLYRPQKPILDGTWKAPELVELN